MPAPARLGDEPLPPDAEVDWNRAYELARDRRDAERERLEHIESKIAPIIAGAIAALGLFVDKASGWPDLLVAALLLVPIALLLTAFQTADYLDFPNLENLVETYQWYPKTYIRATVLGAAESISKNAIAIDRKARELNRAMAVLLFTVIIILGWKAGEAYDEQRSGGKGPTPVSPIPAALASPLLGQPATGSGSAR
jgi:hypothetical protein